MKLSIKDIKYITDASDFGYMGSKYRTDLSDIVTVKAANQVNWTPYELALWLNSSYARHEIDNCLVKRNRKFYLNLDMWYAMVTASNGEVKLLKEEISNVV